MQRALHLLPLLLVAACGPIPVAEAERYCVDRARLAQQPRGELAIGVGSGGWRSSELSVEVTSDYLTGRDPADVFASCVRGRSGQAPTRPLSAMPGWTGR